MVICGHDQEIGLAAGDPRRVFAQPGRGGDRPTAMRQDDAGARVLAGVLGQLL